MGKTYAEVASPSLSSSSGQCLHLGHDVKVKAASASFTYDVERAIVELLHCDPEVAESVANFAGCSSDAAPWLAANN